MRAYVLCHFGAYVTAVTYLSSGLGVAILTISHSFLLISFILSSILTVFLVAPLEFCLPVSASWGLTLETKDIMQFIQNKLIC